MAYFDIVNQIKASFFKHRVYAMTYTWIVLKSFDCHVSVPCLLQAIDCTRDTVYGDNIIKTYIIKTWHLVVA